MTVLQLARRQVGPGALRPVPVPVPAPEPASALVDTLGRRFRYLRLSVTDVCNFRCTYCLPDGWKKTGPASFLTGEEIRRLAAGFVGMGVSKIRLTGGEPTVRRDFMDIVAGVAALPGLEKLAVTTNGWNLARHAAAWRAAGLSHLNLSIDSLDREVFARITGHDRLPQILDGLETALGLGYRGVKVNAVLLRETAEKGFDAWAEFVRERPMAVRFIELMRTGDNADYFADQHVSGEVLRAWLQARGWMATARASDGGPATEYRHPDYRGALGLIAPYGPGFCDGCNRLRVTARGQLRLCLFGQGGFDLRPWLQSDADGEGLAEAVRDALTGKAAGHGLHADDAGDTRNLSQFGG